MGGVHLVMNIDYGRFGGFTSKGTEGIHKIQKVQIIGLLAPILREAKLQNIAVVKASAAKLTCQKV